MKQAIKQVNKNFKEFKKWYDSFIEPYYKCDLHDEEWSEDNQTIDICHINSNFYDKYENSHIEINKLLKTKERHFNIKLEKGKTETIGADLAEGYIENIISWIPFYLKEYGLTEKDLLKDKIGKISLSKHILTYTKKYDILYGRNIYPTVKYYIDLLTKEKKSNTIKFDNLHVKFTIEPKNFIQLGHYGCDSVSCFNERKQNPHCKYNLAKAKNTFVCLFSTQNDFSKPEGRCWGFLGRNNKVLNFCNFYYKGKLADIETKNALLECSKAIFEVEKVHYKEDLIDIQTGSDIYYNQDHFNISISPSEINYHNNSVILNDE